MNFKNLLIIVVSLFFATALISCSRVEPNHEGVLMTDYGKNGKSDFVKATGTVNTMWFGTSLYQVPMYALSGDPDKIVVTAKDGGRFTVDPSYTYQAKRDSGINIIFSYKYLGIAGKLNDEDMSKIESSVLNRLVLDAYREEARNYATDSLLTNINNFEKTVEVRLQNEFSKKYFDITALTSGLTPPASMSENIEQMNNANIKTQTVKNELNTARMLQEKAKIEAATNEITSAGLTKEVLTARWIDAIRNSQNRIIITDGKTPVMLNQ